MILTWYFSEVIAISKPWILEINDLIRFWKIDPISGNLQKSIFDFIGVEFGILLVIVKPVNAELNVLL